MLSSTCRDGKQTRPGASAVELAVLLPFLCFIFVIAVDYARLFYFAVTVENCARNGAYYASNYPNANYVYNDIYGYKNLDEAVLKDASNLSPAPTYTVAYGSSSQGPFSSGSSSANYVQVTVSWTFTSLTNFPGVPGTVTLSRSAVMKIAPTLPSFQ
jgi:Flp pilus assembly protein TadG